MTDSDWNIPTITKIFTSNSDTLAGIADDAGLNKSKILRFITREEINFEDPTLSQFQLKEENIDYSINAELIAISIALNKKIENINGAKKYNIKTSFKKNNKYINAIKNVNNSVYLAEMNNHKGTHGPDKGTATVSIATFNSTIEIDKEKVISIHHSETLKEDLDQTNSELFRIIDKEILNIKKEFKTDQKNEAYDIGEMLEKYISKQPKQKESKTTIFIKRNTYVTEIITLSNIIIKHKNKLIINENIPERFIDNIKNALNTHLFNE